jgi:hypothetical protein
MEELSNEASLTIIASGAMIGGVLVWREQCLGDKTFCGAGGLG